MTYNLTSAKLYFMENFLRNVHGKKNFLIRHDILKKEAPVLKIRSVFKFYSVLSSFDTCLNETLNLW